MSNNKFIHLHLHTEYSIVDGITRINKLIDKACEYGMPAVAVTDQMNLFGLVKFFKKATNAGIKPIIGAECLIESEDEAGAPSRIVFLCQNSVGYNNLCRLISKGFLEGQQSGEPRLSKSWITNDSAEGLIAISSGLHSDIAQAVFADNLNQANDRLRHWSSVFPDRFYLEIQRTGRPNESLYNQAAVEMASKHNIPLVATNDVRFIDEDDFEAHEARICINSGRVLEDPKRPKNYSEKQYFRSIEEMNELFSDIPEALENTVEIAKRCNFRLELGDYYLPRFPTPEGIDTEEDFLRHEARNGLEMRLKQTHDQDSPGFEEKKKIYFKRLEHELDVIITMGFPGYFLIVADFIRWAKANDIPVGPGRGSGAGSLVAYVLEITNLDPIELDLLFERFLNPERVSMPDFDVDFCMENRDRVIEYVARKYGRENVSQIITYGTMAAKAVIRDVGRVLGHPYGFVDRLAKLIPFEIGMTLEKALEQEEELARLVKTEEEVTTLFDLALKLEGVSRNAGKHAGGVVIAPKPLTEFAPIYCESSGEGVVTQFDKDDVETIGLVKFDFLGLRTLTIINWAIQHINKKRSENGEQLLNIDNIPVTDESTFDLLKRCETTAVFQLESRGMKDLIRRLQPDCFDDITALVALFRPGPLQSGMVDDFIDRKHGRSQVTYLHPMLEEVLKPTYGVILYQEQVMQIAQTMSGYTLGGADILRRAMGKKKPEEMAKQRSIFVDGAEKNGIPGNDAAAIFDLIEKFAGYGFNKSHSAAYALLSYQTAWLKAHYPAEFMAAVLSADMENTDKVVILYNECKNMGLKIHAPDINTSSHKFGVKSGEIVYGLGAIKGLGLSAIEIIIEEREKGGAYKTLFDLCNRVDLRKVNRRALEVVIKAGVLDCFGVGRAALLASLEKALKQAEQNKKNQAAGQADMFSLDADASESNSDGEYEVVAEWNETTKLGFEKATLGFYMSGHPVLQYVDELKKLKIKPVAALSQYVGKSAQFAGIVTSMRVVMTKRGKRMAIVRIDDGADQIEVVVFSEIFDEQRPLLSGDEVIIMTGEVSTDDFSGGIKVVANDIKLLSEVRERALKAIIVSFNNEDDGFVNTLQSIIVPYKGGNCAVRIRYSHPEVESIIELGSSWRVNPSGGLMDALESLYGKVELVWG